MPVDRLRRSFDYSAIASIGDGPQNHSLVAPRRNEEYKVELSTDRIGIHKTGVVVVESSVQVDIDETDKAILRLLQADGRISNAEVARRVELSAPATHARVKRLEEAGVIRQYATLLDRETIGYDMVCFISVSLQLHQFDAIERFKELVQDMPEVLECHHITGEFDYLLKAVFRNRDELQEFVVNRLTPIPSMARINTSLVLTEIKATQELPIG